MIASLPSLSSLTSTSSMSGAGFIESPNAHGRRGRLVLPTLVGDVERAKGRPVSRAQHGDGRGQLGSKRGRAKGARLSWVRTCLSWLSRAMALPLALEWEGPMAVRSGSCSRSERGSPTRSARGSRGQLLQPYILHPPTASPDRAPPGPGPVAQGRSALGSIGISPSCRAVGLIEVERALDHHPARRGVGQAKSPAVLYLTQATDRPRPRLARKASPSAAWTAVM